jgi:hypothetical protein
MNYQVQVFETKKGSGSKNCQFQVFQKAQRTIEFHERIDKDPAIFDF